MKTTAPIMLLCMLAVGCAPEATLSLVRFNGWSPDETSVVLEVRRWLRNDEYARDPMGWASAGMAYLPENKTTHLLLDLGEGGVRVLGTSEDSEPPQALVASAEDPTAFAKTKALFENQGLSVYAKAMSLSPSRARAICALPSSRGRLAAYASDLQTEQVRKLKELAPGEVFP
jgi:hypothetical protein